MEVNPNKRLDVGRAASDPVPPKESPIVKAAKTPLRAVSGFFGGLTSRGRSESSPVSPQKSFSKQSTLELDRFMKDYEQKVKEHPHKVSKEVVKQWFSSYEVACKTEGKEHEFYGFASIPIDVQMALLKTTPRSHLVEDFPEMASKFTREIPVVEGSLDLLHNRLRQDFSRSVAGMHFYVSENSPSRVELSVSNINPSWASLLDVQVAAEIFGNLLVVDESALNPQNILRACRKFCEGEDSSEYPAAFSLQSASDPEALLRDPDFRKRLLGEVNSKMEKALPKMQEVAGDRASYLGRVNESIDAINRYRSAIEQDPMPKLSNLGENKIRQDLNGFGFVDRPRSPSSIVEVGGEAKAAPITIGEELAHQVLTATKYATKEEQIRILQTFQITHFSLPMTDLGAIFADQDPPVLIKRDENSAVEFAIHHQGEDLFVKASCKMQAVDSDTEGVIKTFDVNMIFDVRNQLFTYSLQESPA